MPEDKKTEIVCAPAVPTQKNLLCKEGKPHAFREPTRNELKDPNQTKLKFCSVCGLEEYKVEICKHCKFFIENSIIFPIAEAQMSDAGFCKQHRTLYAFQQPACNKFKKMVYRWKNVIGGVEQPEDEKEIWKRKSNGAHKGQINPFNPVWKPLTKKEKKQLTILKKKVKKVKTRNEGIRRFP